MFVPFLIAFLSLYFHQHLHVYLNLPTFQKPYLPTSVSLFGYMLYLSTSLCHYLAISLYLRIYGYRFDYLPVSLSRYVSLSKCSYANLIVLAIFACLSVSLPGYISAFPSVSLSGYICAYLLYLNLATYSICLSICIFIWLHSCLPICIFI